MLFFQFIQIQYATVLKHQYWDPKAEEYLNLPAYCYDENRSITPLSPESVLDALFTMNWMQFMNQCFISVMVVFLFSCGIFTTMTCNQTDYEVARMESATSEMGGEGIELETYDPTNKDDLFGAFQSRVDELKKSYTKLERDFAKKKRQIPSMCPICMENF